MRLSRLKISAAMILAAPAFACAAEPAPAPPATQPASAILRADAPVTIDGNLDEPCWRDAQPVPVAFAYGKLGVRDEPVPMIVKYAWDEHYLYVGYETFDRNLVAVGNGQKKGPPANQRETSDNDRPGVKVDIVEIFVSFNDPNFMWELHHNALNQFNDIWVTVPDPQWPISKSTIPTYGIIFAPHESLKDDGVCTTAMAVKLKPKADGKPSTPNDDSDEDTGYFGELRFPWRALGVDTQWLRPATPDQKTTGPAWNMAGHSVSLMAVSQDGDREPRYHHSSATFPGGWFHQGTKFWPVYQCVDNSSAKAESK